MKEYIIPKNVKTRFEIFEGFGWFELFLLMLGIGIGSIISLILFLIFRSLFCFSFAVFGGAVGFFLGRPDPRTGRSALDLVKDYKDFNTRAKRYFYQFGRGREYKDLFKLKKNAKKTEVKDHDGNATQEWIPIRDVYNHVIYRKDGSLVAAIMVSPVNIQLLSDKEKKRYIQSLEEVLNGIDESFQILSIARPVDLDAYISKLRQMRSEAPNTIKQRLLANYMNHAAQMATSGEALERQFYILLEQKKTGNNEKNDINFLLNRAKEIATNLSGAGLKSHLCSDEELRELLFIFMNPNQAAYERAPSESFQLPTIYAMGD